MTWGRGISRIMLWAASSTFLIGIAACAPLIYAPANSAVETVKGFIPSGNLQTHAVPSIKQIKVDSIAVMPVIVSPGTNGDVVADGGADAVTAELYTQSALAGGWDVIPQGDVVRAMSNMPPTTVQNAASGQKSASLAE